MTIAMAIESHAPGTGQVLVCGGGVHNSELLSRLSSRLPDATLSSTADFGLEPDWVEACAFAWLSLRALEGKPGNAPGVTGASRPTILGGIYATD